MSIDNIKNLYLSPEDWSNIKIRKKPQVGGFRLFEYSLLRLGRKIF